MKIRGSCLLFLALLGGFALAKYSVGSQNITLIEPNQQTYPLTVYYPASTWGEKATPITGHSFPTIIFIHGLLVDRTSFGKLAQGLASAGCVFLIPDLPGGTLPLKSESMVLIDNLTKAIIGKTFMGEIAYLNSICDANRLIIMGHSWGGGLALEIGRTDPRFKLILALAPAILTETSTLNQLATPTVLITGSLDAIVPTTSVRTIYQNLNSPKILLTLKDGTHNGFLDHPSNLEDNLIAGKKMDSDTQINMTVTYCITYIYKYLQG